MRPPCGVIGQVMSYLFRPIKLSPIRRYQFSTAHRRECRQGMRRSSNNFQRQRPNRRPFRSRTASRSNSSHSERTQRLRENQPTLVNPPELAGSNSFSFASEPAPLDGDVNLSSVRPRGQTTLTITNAEQPITEVRDIHGDPISVSTQTVQERAAQLESEILNDTHAEFYLFEEDTGEALSNKTLWLHGAAQGQVTTDSDGTAVVVERSDLYVRASFTGETDPAGRGVLQSS